MKSKIQYLLLGIIGLMVITSSCRSKKGIKQDEKSIVNMGKPSTKDLLIAAIEQQQTTFSYYSANGKASYKDNDTKQDLGVSIVMEKDRFIYMNVTAILGITVARVFATQDSIVILDMLHRKCIIARYDYVRNLTHADLNLTNLQNLFIGNTLFPNNASKSKIDSVLNYILISQAVSSSHTQQTMYRQDLNVTRSTLSDPQKNQEMKVEYEEVYTQGGNQFPNKFSINIRAEKNMETKFELSNFVFEKKKDIQFTIPKSYETVRM
ncbi:MAG: DUF4292 domain-containing protein [Bacteroidota bacterium]